MKWLFSTIEVPIWAWLIFIGLGVKHIAASPLASAFWRGLTGGAP